MTYPGKYSLHFIAMWTIHWPSWAYLEHFTCSKIRNPVAQYWIHRSWKVLYNTGIEMQLLMGSPKNWKQPGLPENVAPPNLFGIVSLPPLQNSNIGKFQRCLKPHFAPENGRLAGRWFQTWQSHSRKPWDQHLGWRNSERKKLWKLLKTTN